MNRPRIGEGMLAATVLGAALGGSPDAQAKRPKGEEVVASEHDEKKMRQRGKLPVDFMWAYEARFKEIEALDPSRVETITNSKFTVEGENWLLDATRVRFNDGYETLITARHAAREASPSSMDDAVERALIVSHEGPAQTSYLFQMDMFGPSEHSSAGNPKYHFAEVTLAPGSNLLTGKELHAQGNRNLLDGYGDLQRTPEGMFLVLNSLYILTEGARAAGLEDATEEFEARLKKLTSDSNYVIVERGEEE